MKRGYKYIADNIGKAIAVITLTVTALVLFTDIGFLELGGKSFTSTMAVIMTASYLMYFSLEDAGEKLGEESNEYKSAKKSYDEIRSKIKGEDMQKLRSFCNDYSAAELEYRQRAFLMQHGYGYDEYKAYKRGDAVKDERSRRMFKKADRLRAIRITPRTLLSPEKTRSESELKNPEGTKLIISIIRLIPCTVSMVITVSIMLTAKEDLSAVAVINGMLKLAGVTIIGFKGYSAGYNYARNSQTLWTETKTRLLEAFINEQKT